ncbi:MAG: hypothetical protein ACK56I_26300, partial [bacterium]
RGRGRGVASDTNHLFAALFKSKLATHANQKCSRYDMCEGACVLVGNEARVHACARMRTMQRDSRMVRQGVSVCLWG